MNENSWSKPAVSSSAERSSGTCKCNGLLKASNVWTSFSMSVAPRVLETTKINKSIVGKEPTKVKGNIIESAKSRPRQRNNQVDKESTKRCSRANIHKYCYLMMREKIKSAKSQPNDESFWHPGPRTNQMYKALICSLARPQLVAILSGWHQVFIC